MELATGIFNDSYDPVIDGVAIVTRNYAFWLNRMLGPSCVVAPGVPGHRDREPFPTLRYASVPIPGRQPYRFGLPWLDPGFLRALGRTRFDLVHAQAPFSAGRVALQLARKRGIPIVGTFHSKYRDNFEEVMPVKGLVDWEVGRIVSFYDQLDEVWVPSRPTVEILRDYGFRKPIEVVPNGTDFEAGGDIAERRSRTDRRWGLEADVPVLLYVGQLIWEKNLELVIEALRLLKEKGMSFRMVFVGEGYAREGMERMAGKKGLGQTALFTGPILEREGVKDWYARASIFLFPSLYDVSPLAIREAAAFQVPTIMVEGSTISDGISDGSNGFLISNNPGALSDRLFEVLDHPELLHQAGAGAYRTLHLSWQEVVSEVRDRYLRLVERRRAALRG